MSSLPSLSKKILWNLPVAAQLRRNGFLNSYFRKGFGRHWGRFETFEEARDFLPSSKRVTYDNDEIVPINLESFATIHSFDWPVLFFLQRIFNENALRVITDFGGHIGSKYYAYKDMLTLPADLCWQVVDVPAVVREGRRRLTETPTLHFYEKLEETQACDILLCSGVLQYAELSIDEIVARLPKRPARIIVNKVALSENESFYTLEDFGKYRMPYHILAPDALKESRLRLGYTLLAHWPIPSRDFIVPSAKGKDHVSMVGEAWML
ncbi:TIGR04325 family methyltransferase [Beijerinckia indica]|uniref:Methyltransferase, TIGR04325 family n=1 Tax=Beijerinckia indica subsp. indica (strain ATCC 9039 / DSM 1715 / NCIMB 8712) TaxID=395963 RepID=B2IE04_BEII9|nr:TIGR04325 family methyltransferase [Beijerinckia indica]ACB94028.1 hypothetical protein Bind_0374 [Beijerinckia indica subsp. indica ATCC 9039]